MSKVHNYSAGPCILPPEVMKKASESVIELDGIGLSLIEISHRSKEFVAIMEKARDLVRELLNVPDNYTVLFLQGGASLGFYQSAINYMKNDGGRGAYVDTGSWSNKAMKEAALLGEVVELASSKADNYQHIPKGYKVPSDVDYLHLTSNNTIFGTQFKSIPESDVPVLCDMSSDIFSKPIDVSKFDLIYGGAQKNMGPAGTTVYIVNKDSLGKTGRKIPSMLDLQVHDSKDSMFNTPPVFSIYVSMLTMEWMKSIGGMSAMQKRNDEKAALIYGEIDRNPLFKGTTAVEDRSTMNATFVLNDEAAHKERFDKLWNDARISGLKGHRSVGGYRASMYNALPVESVKVLVDVMKELERTA
ncbi:MAG: 3-phosphoserine/phosphohydroxythreonine transaminase [Flavobacteriales bacterium]|nr:3-phosphoserine/phosphohydroxythreonine transaminase [Flavobacteriales bacterium]